MTLDVIVVGAGPSGALAARRCAQRGLKTLILERETLPRYKSCGGGITRGATDLLDFQLPSSLIEGECFGIQVRYCRHSANIRRHQRIAFFTTRARFDAFLTEKAIEAGADLHERSRVTSVEVLDSHALVCCGSKQYSTKLVIGADGAHSMVAKNIRPSFTRDQIGIACDVILENDEIDFPDRGLAVFEFGDVPGGYSWIFPRKDYLGVGIGATATMLQRPKETLLSVLQQWGVKHTNREAHWCVLPAGGFTRKTCADRIMLVGDAAGFVDPLFGGGIELAFRSATYAAETAYMALDAGDPCEITLNGYAEKCDQAFGHSLRTMRRLASLMHRYPDFLIKPFAMSAKLTELVFGSMLP